MNCLVFTLYNMLVRVVNVVQSSFSIRLYRYTASATEQPFTCYVINFSFLVDKFKFF